jgi:hypothetical protein
MSIYQIEENSEVYWFRAPASDTCQLVEFLRPRIESGFDVHIGVFERAAVGATAEGGAAGVEEDLFEFEKPGDPEDTRLSAEVLQQFIDEFRKTTAAA